ncbi:molybdopterin biosynthesis protein MoeB [Rubripirellula tenax]|uniref:Molybdopterin biosynthesis protein MoeB n=1 Tax=Rubripirellula tenax TaxID=2528015 RepID=A0A5C6FBL2_9BACT|nr:rhodanese-like domain-containing protein [Rubripirellula tenax]TWU56989.1 molybdopterin biosynthesis protein MoeB [Rubripirellula tenax]
MRSNPERNQQPTACYLASRSASDRIGGVLFAIHNHPGGFSMEDQQRHYLNKLAYEIDSWDLKVALESDDKIVVVDARSPDAYRQGHIPGAINIPHRTMSMETTSIVDKDSLVVTYCDGIGCNASTKGALQMLKLGFRVKELLGGLDWWKRDQHPVHCEGSSDGQTNCGCG